MATLNRKGRYVRKETGRRAHILRIAAGPCFGITALGIRAGADGVVVLRTAEPVGRPKWLNDCFVLGGRLGSLRAKVRKVPEGMFGRRDSTYTP
jgi:hypothetical protein